MALSGLINGVIALTILGIVGLILLWEFVKRWRINLRVSSGDESLLSDGSISMKTVTDAPPGSAIVSRVPAVEIKES